MIARFTTKRASGRTLSSAGDNRWDRRKGTINLQIAGCAPQVRDIPSRLSQTLALAGSYGPEVPRMPRPIQFRGGSMAVQKRKAAPMLLPLLTWITGLILAGVPRIR